VNGIKYANSTVQRESNLRMRSQAPQRKIVLGESHEHEHYDDGTDGADGDGGDVRSRFDGWDRSLSSLGSVFTLTLPSFEFVSERFPFPSISFSFSSRDGDLRFVPPVVIEVDVGGVTVRIENETVIRGYSLGWVGRVGGLLFATIERRRGAWHDRPCP